ncbi:uncharacterized protein LOC108733377 [Agrilus planipennis]|uniref:Uncharacterized protein LOC108733377 n=1 Tax=Agrilus planipennis TaxID=224129 RepID=A0A1W4W7E1_AGRPL|nr:uncharacterized protein LOC108733377 [Agrilus planipennis]
MHSIKKLCNIFNLSNLRQFHVCLYSSSEKSIIIDHMDYITVIGINRPQKRNCIDRSTAALLTEAITNFENDNKSRAAVLYGTGGNFCAGNDLDELANSNEDNFRNYCNNGLLGPTRRFIKKPIVAALSGYAVGGGLELAAMCDLRVMEDTAVLGLYNRRFGMPLLDGGSVRLTAMLGISRALDLILTGRLLHAKEALEWGLVNRIVDCGTSLGQAVNLATCLIKYPQKSLLADRKSAYNAAYKTAYVDLLEFERENGLKTLAEAKEGAKLFISGYGKHGKSFTLLEKDIPDWELEDNQHKS